MTVPPLATCHQPSLASPASSGSTYCESQMTVVSFCLLWGRSRCPMAYSRPYPKPSMHTAAAARSRPGTRPPLRTPRRFGTPWMERQSSPKLLMSSYTMGVGPVLRIKSLYSTNGPSKPPKTDTDLVASCCVSVQHSTPRGVEGLPVGQILFPDTPCMPMYAICLH